MIINKECFDANTDCSTSTLVCCRKCKQMFNKHPCLLQRKCKQMFNMHPCLLQRKCKQMFNMHPCLLQKVQTDVQHAPLLVAEKVQTNVQQAPLLAAKGTSKGACTTTQGCLYNKRKRLIHEQTY